MVVNGKRIVAIVLAVLAIPCAGLVTVYWILSLVGWSIQRGPGPSLTAITRIGIAGLLTMLWVSAFAFLVAKKVKKTTNRIVAVILALVGVPCAGVVTVFLGAAFVSWSIHRTQPPPGDLAARKQRVLQLLQKVGGTDEVERESQNVLDRFVVGDRTLNGRDFQFLHDSDLTNYPALSALGNGFKVEPRTSQEPPHLVIGIGKFRGAGESVVVFDLKTDADWRYVTSRYYRQVVSNIFIVR